MHILCLIFISIVQADCIIPPNDQCAYVKNHCDDIPLLVNYLQLLYCSNQFPLVFALMVMLIVIIFYLLSVSSSQHFIPILTILSKHLSMSSDLAGITILAIGNGAPDVFSTFVAIFNTGDFNLAIAEVIGAGCFVSSVIVASIVIFGNNIQLPQTIITIISFYVMSLLFVFYVCITENVGIITSICFVIIYVVFVTFTWYVTRGNPLVKVAAHLESDTRLLDNDELVDEEILASMEKEVHTSPKVNIILILASNLLRIMSRPITAILECTTPHIEDTPTLLLISYALSPLPFCIVSQLSAQYWPVPFIVLSGIALVIYFTKTSIPTLITNVYGLIVSILYIYIFASELVSILESIGVALKIDSSLLGVTVLCWGNSVGDFVSNVLVSTQGYSEMGISASYGGPCFNVLVGLGFGALARTFKTFPNPLKVRMTDTIFYSVTYLIVMLLLTLVFVSVYGQITKTFGFALLVSYGVVLTLSILSTFNIIQIL